MRSAAPSSAALVSAALVSAALVSAALVLPSCKPAPPEAVGFTLAYSGRLEGEIEPCG